MHVTKAPKRVKETDNLWDQREFRKFWNSLSPQRCAQDKKILRNLFKKAQKFPWLAKELEWAKKHGVKFFIDRSTSLSGYYTPNTGVIAIAYKKKGSRLETLGHEIRHASQEYKGLLYTGFGVLKRMAIESLLEADATAAEKMALKRQRYFKCASACKALFHYFKDWYSSKNPEIYCKTIARLYADVYGEVYEHKKPAQKSESLNEFNPCNTACTIKKNNILHLDGFKKLGEAFNGLNYLDTPKTRLFLEKAMDPALIKKFYNPKREKTNRRLQMALDYERRYMPSLNSTSL